MSENCGKCAESMSVTGDFGSWPAGVLEAVLGEDTVMNWLSEGRLSPCVGGVGTLHAKGVTADTIESELLRWSVGRSA